MASNPEIFISASSADLRSCRYAIRKWVLAQVATPVTFDEQPFDGTDTRQLLRARMASCEVVLHVAGECYGPEPETVGNGARRSYAQLEYDTARSLGKPVHTFVCLEGFPYDSHEMEPVALRSMQQAHRAALTKAHKVGDTLELIKQLKKLRLDVAPPKRKKARLWPAAVAITLLTVGIAGAALAFVYQRDQENKRLLQTNQMAKESQSRFASAHRMLESVASHCILDWEFNQPMAADARLEAAYATVAEESKTTAIALHGQFSQYAAAQANPEATQLDHALTDFTALQFDSAAAHALQAAEQFHSQCVTEETTAEAAHHKAGTAGGKLKLRLTATAEADAATERSHAIQDQEISAWVLAGHCASLGNQLRQAAESYQKAMALAEGNPSSLKWPEAAQGLALVQFRKGLREECESMLRKAIERRTAAAEPDDPANIEGWQNLATLLYARGDANLAEPLFRQVLEARERRLGPDHPATISAASSLAGFLMKGGNFAGAEPLFRHVLEVQERTLPENDPAILNTLSNLAGVLTGKRDLAGAEEIFQHVVEARKSTLGLEHPSTLASINNLAALLTNKGDFEHAEPLFRQVLEARERTLGLGHPSVMASVNSFAVMLRSKGDTAGVEKLLREVLELQDEELGENDPASLLSASNLANLLYTEKKFAEAELLLRRVMDGQREALGDDHPETLSSMKTVAYLLQSKGDYAGAEPIYRRILKAQEHTLGPENAETLGTVQNLANLLLILGRFDAAEPLLHHALEAHERVLGKSSPNTALAAYAFSSLRRRQGRFREAITFAREAVECARASLPAGDKNRLMYQQQLAAVETELAIQERKLPSGKGSEAGPWPPRSR